MGSGSEELEQALLAYGANIQRQILDMSGFNGGGAMAQGSGSEQPQQPMSDVRLAKIRQRVHEAGYDAKYDDDPWALAYSTDVPGLLVENEHLRTREAALVAALRGNWMFLHCQECAAWREVEQALPELVAALREAEQQKASSGYGR